MGVDLIPQFRDTFEVLYDDDNITIIHATIFGKFPKLPKANSKEEFIEKFSQLEYRKSRDYVLRRLTQRDYPSTQLRKMLLERKVSEENTDRVIDEFTKSGYFKDDEWVERFIRQEKNKGVGPRNIAMKLKIKGFHDIEVPEDAEEQQDTIKRLLQRKYQGKETRKAIASLMRKGFSYNDIRQALDEGGFEN